jgi:hypothetical protein
MSKNLLLVLFVLALIPFKMNAEWVSLNQTKTNAPPIVTILSEDNSSTVIKVELNGFDINEFITDGKTYQKIDLGTEIFTTTVGYPELPHIAKVLAIPDHASVSVEVLEMGTVQTFNNLLLQPARESWYEGEPETPFIENAEAYLSNNAYPKEFIAVEEPAVFRDFRIARFSFYPLRYVSAKKELQVVSSITYRINYGDGEVINPKTSPTRPIAPSFANLYRSFIFNYEQVLNRRDVREEGHELMLCIMPDEFVASFQVYADWNRKTGTDVHVTKFSDINANANNPDIIKAHISDAYNNWEVAPTYVLIIGDEGIFPHKIVTYPDYSFPNEDYFVEVEGNDYFPEMMIGRFTNQGEYRMQVMINKYQMYEEKPYVEDTDWFKKGVCCSNNDYESQVETKRFAYRRMVEDGGFAVDTMMSDGTGWGGQGCTYNTNDVVDRIDEGRSFLNYRGEGWYSGWSATCYDFNTDDVSGLQNGEKFTFVTSIGCGVAGFHSSGGNCFGEEWVQLGSITAPRGGVAFIGPTSNTHTTYNNKIDKGIYQGMFRENMDTPGQALLRGKLYMYNVYGNVYNVEYHYKVYCVLGDPSLHIWKDVPLEVTVDHPASSAVGDHQIEVTVNHTASGQVVDSVWVCLTNDNVFVTGMTDLSGKAILNVTLETTDTLWVTVRGRDVYPYQGYMLITQEEEQVEPTGQPVIVDLDGNTDGLINPNENCSITYTLKNWGTGTVNNVQATLTSGNPDLVQVITTDPINFGTLSPGTSFTGEPFQFHVDPSCPIGGFITLHLNVTSNNSSWDFNTYAMVFGCELVYDRFVVHEMGTSNVNFKMNPGETVQLFTSIINDGEDIAPGVMGILSTNDPYMTIEDADGTYGTVEIGGLAKNMDDYYVVSIDESCPTGYMADFTLKLFTEGGNYPYETIPTISLPVGLNVPTDYTGPDAYGYFAISSNDAFYEQTPVYDWIEIDAVGTKMNLIPLISDYTQTVNLPFDFKYYGINYNQLRISTDGWVAFGSGTQVAPTNQSMPSYDIVNNMVAVFWDDLYEGDDIDGDIYYYHDAANHRFIVEWDSITHNDYQTEPHKEVFQVVLLDPAHYTTYSGDGEIICQYKKVVEILSNSIGIENHTQTVGLKYVFNNAYVPTASLLQKEFAIKFTTEAPYGYLFVGVDDDNAPGNANGYKLDQNTPNPFNQSTVISYSIPQQSNLTLSVYNFKGDLVRTLQSGLQMAGNYSVEWNGLTDNGNAAKPGIYFYRLQTEDFTQARKLLLLK